MRIELHSSNRNEWPLGTGRSPMHGRALTELRRRTTHGPRGTAQGNRGSAAQGGIRANPGFLPFQTSAIAVGALAPAGLAIGAATGAAPDLSLVSQLFREPLMSIGHLVLGCVVVLAALATCAITVPVSFGVLLMRPCTT